MEKRAEAKSFVILTISCSCTVKGDEVLDARKIPKIPKFVLIIVVVLSIFALAFITLGSKNILIISRQADEMEVAKKILTTGEWHTSNEFGDVVIKFTNEEYSAVRTFLSDNREENITGHYKLTDVTVENATWKTFNVKGLITDSEKGIPEVADLKIVGLRQDGKNFLLTSPSLPFTQHYFKHFDFTMTSAF